jgi:hypothetical protein
LAEIADTAYSGETVAPLTYQPIEVLLAQGRWREAAEKAREIGSEALRRGRFPLARKAGGLLERLEDFGSSAHLMSISMRELDAPMPLPEWDGSDISGRTLLVVSRNMHVGNMIRFSRLLALAQQRAKRTIVVAEARLVPLMRRSFPGLEVRTEPQLQEAFQEADVVASYETLIRFLAVDEAGRIKPLPPLVADTARASEFRAKYGSGPLVGICWHSTNEKKDLPSLDDWGLFLRKQNARYVSIQYGDAAADVERLRELSGMEIVHDETVDSLKDLDVFAAQVAALDAVVTISNTGAHMAGSLNIPMFVLLDDKDQLMWPFVGRTTSWYPRASLYRKAARSWRDVFLDVSADLCALTGNIHAGR